LCIFVANKIHWDGIYWFVGLYYR